MVDNITTADGIPVIYYQKGKDITPTAVKTVNFSTIVEFFPDFLDVLLIKK